MDDIVLIPYLTDDKFCRVCKNSLGMGSYYLEHRMQEHNRLSLDLNVSKYRYFNCTNVSKINETLGLDAESSQFFANLKNFKIE